MRHDAPWCAAGRDWYSGRKEDGTPRAVAAAATRIATTWPPGEQELAHKTDASPADPVGGDERSDRQDARRTDSAGAGAPARRLALATSDEGETEAADELDSLGWSLASSEEACTRASWTGQNEEGKGQGEQGGQRQGDEGGGEGEQVQKKKAKLDVQVQKAKHESEDKNC